MIDLFSQSNWEEELLVTPKRDLKSIELFAGAGGLALGLEKAGFNTILLNEKDKYACETLRFNRPNWNVLEGDICNINFSEYKDGIDLLSGGFLMQVKVKGLMIFEEQCFFNLHEQLKRFNLK